MGWEGARVLVHEPTRTLVRCNGGRAQLLRAGVAVAEVHASAEVVDEFSIATDGTLFAGHEGLLDLTTDRPVSRPAPEIASSGSRTLRPDGRVVVLLTRACVGDRNTPETVRALHRRVPEGAFQLALVGEAGGLEVLVEASARLPAGGRAFAYLAHAMFAADGRHWMIAVADYEDDHTRRDHRLILGRDGQVLTHRRLAFEPSVRHATFDLARGLLVLCSRQAAATFSSSDGALVAERTWEIEPKTRAGSMQSPLVPHGDALVAVVSTETAKTYALCGFDPETLAPRGPVPGVPTLRDPDGDFGLAPLGPRGLAWAPTVNPVVLVDADDSWREGPLVRRHVVESPTSRDAERVVDVARASPAERVLLAGHLLERRERDPRFVPLVRAHPEAFRPHLAAMLGWPREWKKMLRELDYRRWMQIARGAPDDVVDALAGSIGDATYDSIELGLLFAVDTPRALERIAGLARGREDVRRACAALCLEIPASGPAVRRFDPNERVLRVVADDAHRPGSHTLETRLDPDAWLDTPRGIACLLPPLHLLRVPLVLLRCEPPANIDAYDFALSTCMVPGCDEWGGNYEIHAASASVRRVLTSNWLERISMVATSECCPGTARAPLAAPERVEVAAFEPAHVERRQLGRVGGRPDWTQSPEPPACPRCTRLMFFVGQLDTAALGVSIVDLFGFVCERCAITIQVSQNT